MALKRSRRQPNDQLDLFGRDGNEHEHVDSIRIDGRGTLAGAPATDGGGNGADGHAPADVAGGRGEDQGRNGRDSPTIDPAGTNATAGPRPSLGDGKEQVHPASAGERLGPPRNLANYRVTDRDRLGEGSLKQKFRANVEAIKLLRSLESEKRPASDDEKPVLVRYVGWGGLPQVFDVNSREWFKEQVELSKLLTDEEHTSARASTLNAHYTSPVIVRGMYAALARFGFRHGRILEPACGLGHFIGLTPEEMHTHSTITGIEIDLLTARLAKALYPDADIRHQPFEEDRLADR